MSKGLLCSVRHKQYISTKCKNIQKMSNFRHIIKKYKNTFTKLLKLAKNRIYENKFKKVSYNPKLTWKLVDEITSDNSKNNDTIKTILVNDKMLNIKDNLLEAPNVFNNYFIYTYINELMTP